jgi:hypothetical protein
LALITRADHDFDDVGKIISPLPERAATTSLTQSVRDFMNREVPVRISASDLARDALDDVYKATGGQHKTLYDFVQADPDTATRFAETCVYEWTQVISQAAITGVICTDLGTVRLTKEITDLLKERIRSAEKTLEQVRNYALSAAGPGQTYHDQVVTTLVNKAVKQGDTRSLMYLYDRLEGRPAESKTISMDYSNSANVYSIICSLFDKQLQVLNSGHGLRIVCCSRRSGKTLLAGALLLIECLRVPNTTAIYISQTMELAERIIMGAMNQIIDTCHLTNGKGERLNPKKFDNGSSILIRGLSNTRDPDLIRGNKAKVIVIDEFFHITEDGLLEYMMNEVLEPMMLDYANDYTMLLLGTPPRVKGTYGERMWLNSDVPKFSWTFRDNPHPSDLQARIEFVNKKLEEKGLDWNSSYAQREYNGQFVYDEDAMLYGDYHTYNPETFMPDMDITDVFIGVDYGMSDYTAIVAVVWDKPRRKGFVAFEAKFNRWDLTKGITIYERLRTEAVKAWGIALDAFGPRAVAHEANKHILWDADSSELAFTTMLKQELSLPRHPDLVPQIDNAHKTDKILMQDKIAALFRTSALLLPEGSKIAMECDKTILLRDPDTGAVLPEVDEKYYHPDLLDALRYAMWNAVDEEVLAEREGGDFNTPASFLHDAPSDRSYYGSELEGGDL